MAVVGVAAVVAFLAAMVVTVADHQMTRRDHFLNRPSSLFYWFLAGLSLRQGVNPKDDKHFIFCTVG